MQIDKTMAELLMYTKSTSQHYCRKLQCWKKGIVVTGEWSIRSTLGVPISHQMPPYSVDQSETWPILLPVAVRQSVMSTWIITVTVFRSQIMLEKRIAKSNSVSLAANKARDTCCQSSNLALEQKGTLWNQQQRSSNICFLEEKT